MRSQLCPLFSLKENIFENKEHGKNVHNGGNILPFLASKIDYNVRNDAERDTFRDAVKEGHGDDAEISGDGSCIIVSSQLEICDITEYQEADDDERGGCCKGGNCCEDGCEKHGNEEEECSRDSCQPRSAACRNTRSRFHESRRCGSAENSACGGSNRVCHQSRLDLRKSAVFIEHICFRADTDERTERIEKVNEKERKNDDDEIKDADAVHINLETLTKGFAEFCEIGEFKRRIEGIEACCRIGNINTNELAEHTESPSRKNTNQNRAFDIFHVKNRGEERTDDCKEGADTNGIEIFREINDGNESRTVNGEFCILQADKGDEKPDADGNGIFEL